MTVFVDDPDLLARFRAGDREALSRVYWSYVVHVEGMVRRGLRFRERSGSHARVEVADVVQEVFTRAFAHSTRRSYDGTREYGRFLYTIAYHALVDFLRRRGRELPTETLELEGLLESTSSGSTSSGEPPCEAPWADARTIALVKRYLASLPAEEYRVYVQRYDEGRSQEQTAAALGLTRQRVRTLDAHLRTGLARELARANFAARIQVAAADAVAPPSFAKLVAKDE